MTTRTATLVEFLTARLDEDETAAQAAASGGRWHYSDGDSVGAWTLYDEGWNIASMTTYDTKAYDYSARMPAFRNPGYIDPDANGRHIARHDPARVLAEVDAKRRIVALHGETVESAVVEGGNCDECGIGRVDWGPGDPADFYPQPWPCRTLRYLALPYADHPDYDEAWRP